MNSDLSKLIFSIIFSILFTIALFYATFILPTIIGNVLKRIFPDIYQWHDIPENISLLYQCAMIIGISTFILSIAFIILGFIVRWTKISFIGALTLYLPVFSGFAFSMFLFAGIGVLRYIWYPMVQVFGGYAEILLIGYSILLLPLCIIMAPFLILDSLGITSQATTTVYVIMILVIIFIGFTVLAISIATWLYYRLKGVKIIKQGIYRYSRHPQYLGLLLWCYSLLLLYSSMYVVPFANYPPPAMPYLILLFTIVGIALIEEQKLIEKYGNEYIDYRRQTPFLIPLHKAIKDAILWIPRKVIKKDLPETRMEIVKVLMVYFIILTLLSMPFDILFYSHIY